MNPQALLVEYLRLVESSGAHDTEHVAWMCREIWWWLQSLALGTTPQGPLATMLKTSRWIGYLQRWLEERGLRTLDQLRNETRGLDAVLIGYL